MAAGPEAMASLAPTGSVSESLSEHPVVVVRSDDDSQSHAAGAHEPPTPRMKGNSSSLAEASMEGPFTENRRGAA